MACAGPAWNCGKPDFVAIDREISHPKKIKYYQLVATYQEDPGGLPFLDFRLPWGFNPGTSRKDVLFDPPPGP